MRPTRAGEEALLAYAAAMHAQALPVAGSTLKSVTAELRTFGFLTETAIARGLAIAYRDPRHDD